MVQSSTDLFKYFLSFQYFKIYGLGIRQHIFGIRLIIIEILTKKNQKRTRN